MASTSPTDTGGLATGGSVFDPGNVDLTAAADDAGLQAQITCFLQLGSNEYNGDLGEFDNI